MMFRLFTGTFRTLEKMFVSDLQTERAKDPLPSLLVLSPSGRLLTHLQRKLSEKNAFLNIHFLTFYALAERLMADSGYLEQIITEPAFYQEMILQILTGDNPEPVDLAIRKAFQIDGKAISRGLSGALAATMKDLRDSGMRADRAIQVTQEGFLGAEAPEAAATLALYARLVGLFEKKNLRSSADLLRRAAKEAPPHPWIRQQKAIFLYGFYDLTGVQLDLVLSLANHPNARVYFPYEEGHKAYGFAEKLLQDPAFVSKAAPKSSSPSIPVGDPSLTLTMDSPPATAGNDGKGPAIQIWSCSGSRDEIWLAAKEILRLSEKGVAFRDIAIIDRRLEPYLSPLADLFESHQIPYFTSRGLPAGLHPLTKMIWSLVSYDERHPLAAILRKDFEKSPYIVMPSSPAGSGRGSMVRQTSGGDIKELPWSIHIDATIIRIQDHIRLPQDASELEQSLFEEILGSLEALRILERMDTPITRDRFLEAWEEKLNALELPVGQAHDGVQVLNVLEARGLSFKAVILLGLNEKSFPRLIREDPFLSDAARGALAQATGCRLAKKLDGYDEERLLFELMRQSALDHLTLVTQRSDEEGKALIPSIYLQEYFRENGGKSHRLPRPFPYKFREYKVAPGNATPKEISYLKNREEASLKELEPLYMALGWNKAQFQSLMAAQAELERFQKGILARDGLIVTPELLKSAIEAGFSPTSLQDLAECPFQYYAGQVLAIKPEEDSAPDGELTQQALGTLFHRVLEIFYESLRSTKMPSPEKLPSVLETACRTAFTEFETTHPPLYPVAWKAAKAMVQKTLLTFLLVDIEECNENKYVPTYFEEQLQAYIPAITGSDSVSFHGKPDRIDVQKSPTGDRLRIVDYKTGKARELSGKIETQLIKGKFLQLPIYMGLASRLGKVESAAIRWVRPENEEAEPPTLEASFWETGDAKILAENIKGLIRLAREGHFFIEPDTGDWGYCARCAYTRICRKEHMRTRSRSEWDPARRANRERLNRTAEASPAPKEKKPIA